MKKIVVRLILIGLVLSFPQLILAGKDKTNIKIAVRSHVNVQRAMNKWQPTVDHLNNKLTDYHFTLHPYTSIEQQIEDGKNNKYHFILTNPAMYVELEYATGATALVTLINNRKNIPQTRFGSVIFTHVDNSHIVTLEDLKGRTFMGVNPIGFGGWRVALKEFMDQGINPEKDFAKLVFGGTQTGVVTAIRNKEADAGVVRTDMLERLAEKGEIKLTEFRILNQKNTKGFPFFHSSQLYPEWPFAVMPHTDKELASQISTVLLNIKPSDPAAISGKYIGWTRALSYEPVKKLLRQLGIGPYRNSGYPNDSHLLLTLAILAFVVITLYLYLSRHKRA